MTTQHYCISTTATTIRFSWSKRFIEEENIIGEIDGFDIKYRDSKEGRWYNKHVSNENETFKLEIDRLKSNHVYDINITWQDKDADIAEYKPSKYESSDEKTLLLLGPTGTGKSTFIDALLNYIKGVSYRNNYRYTLINETKEEKERSDQKSQSQTSSVTVYRIPTIDGGQVSHKVNIIDTPGFNDTRENFDERITQQIRELFEIRRGKHSVIHLDAILVVVPLSTQRLTHQLKEVFSNILHMFGKDIAKNIFAVITFDDGEKKLACLSLGTQKYLSMVFSNSTMQMS
ncbi:unnamed protein product [Mytilus edulis]|uniref:AIG1-type G domain-containing protein n=1 Tax=Mytilus edulis TaxID=6550 RepID=A0A8S3T7E5_MYTED|nr:unnamed protein product [Mytilus edulis]